MNLHNLLVVKKNDKVPQALKAEVEMDEDDLPSHY